MDDPRKPGQEPPAGDSDWGFGDAEAYEDAVPLHTGEVEILEDDAFSESFAGGASSESETAVGKEPGAPVQQGVEEEALFDDGLSFDEEAFPSEEEVVEGDDELAVVDDLDASFEEGGAFEEEVVSDEVVSDEMVASEENEP